MFKKILPLLLVFGVFASSLYALEAPLKISRSVFINALQRLENMYDLKCGPAGRADEMAYLDTLERLAIWAELLPSAGKVGTVEEFVCFDARKKVAAEFGVDYTWVRPGEETQVSEIYIRPKGNFKSSVVRKKMVEHSQGKGVHILFGHELFDFMIQELKTRYQILALKRSGFIFGDHFLIRYKINGPTIVTAALELDFKIKLFLSPTGKFKPGLNYYPHYWETIQFAYH